MYGLSLKVPYLLYSRTCEKHLIIVPAGALATRKTLRRNLINMMCSGVFIEISLFVYLNNSFITRTLQFNYLYFQAFCLFVNDNQDIFIYFCMHMLNNYLTNETKNSYYKIYIICSLLTEIFEDTNTLIVH